MTLKPGFFLLLFCLPLICPAAIWAGDDGTFYAVAANNHYERGDHAQAAESYRKAIGLGVNNGHIYYNLANCYYRLGRYGAAIANYRRALRYLPGDPDVLFNLRLARTKAVDRIEDPHDFTSILAKLLRPREAMSTRGAVLLFIVLYCLFWAAVAVLPIIRQPVSRPAAVLLCLLTVYAALLAFGTKEDRDGRATFALSPAARNIRPAVVAQPEAPVRSGNSDRFQVVFRLHDGAEVRTGETRDNWVEIFLPDGKRGWVKSDTLELL